MSPPNDAVVIFDRVREQVGLRPKDQFAAVANDAALETLPRTINTGLSTLFILVALWLLGGETLADFALALIIGIVVGTTSSVLTAVPLATVLERSSPSGDASVTRTAPVEDSVPSEPALAGTRGSVIAESVTEVSRPSSRVPTIAPRPRKNRGSKGRRR